MSASQKLGEAMYAQSQGQPGGGGAGAGGQPGGGGEQGGEEKVVDAEYTEVKDRK
jgi:molecular chaperone DnaK